MKDGKNPDPDVLHPIEGYEKEIYLELAEKQIRS